MASVSSTSTSSNETSSSKTAKQKSQESLQLLLTQLQNQNPTDPVKTSEYTTQLLTYSILEQDITSNDKLDSLIKNTGSSAVSPTSYLGTTVDYSSSVAPVQNNKAIWTYSTTDASEVTITVTDASGKTVYSGNGDKSAGEHVLNLSTSGSSYSDGSKLTIKVTAKNSDGATVKSTITARATIDAVDTSSGTTKLEASGYVIDSSKVTRITQPETTTTSTTSSSSSS